MEKKTKENVLGVVKAVGGILASIGSAEIINNVVKATTPANTKIGKISKAAIWVASLVIGDIVGEKASEQVSKYVDDGVNIVKRVFKIAGVNKDENEQPKVEEAEG